MPGRASVAFVVFKVEMERLEDGHSDLHGPRGALSRSGNEMSQVSTWSRTEIETVANSMLLPRCGQHKLGADVLQGETTGQFESANGWSRSYDVLSHQLHSNDVDFEGFDFGGRVRLHAKAAESAEDS